VQVAGRIFHSRRVTIVAALALSLGGCAGLLGGSKGPPPTYDLTAPHTFPRSSRAPRGQLVVPEATALGVLDTDKIVVRPVAGEITALADAQWGERLPKLVQARVIQTFENASRLRAVGRPSDRITADYQLLLDIRAFQISVPAGPAAEVEIAVKIVNERSGRIFAGRVFRVLVPAAATEGPAAAAVLDQAFGRAAVDLVLWTTSII
jgi:ABC-type uncharacterized transport system auxiliary subunit